MIKLPKDQEGMIHFLPLLLVVAAVGVISYLLVSTTAPLNDRLFSTVNPKSQSKAATDPMMAMSDECLFKKADGSTDMTVQPAFCDTFNTPMPGGRAGDLDERKWSFFRVSNGSNPTQGQYNPVAAADEQYCQTVRRGIYAPDDSFICGSQFGEPNHWMDAQNDDGGALYKGARIRQPFDFTNRTGTITFAVDAKTEGGHGYWPTVELAEDTMPGPYHAQFFAGPQNPPKNGVEIAFDNQCYATTAGTYAAPHNIVIFNNYNETAIDFDNPGHQWGNVYNSWTDCYTTQNDHANLFNIKISKTSIEVWASDKSDDHGMTYPHFRKIAWVNNINLPITKGYLSFFHVDYNAEKFSNLDPNKEGMDNGNFVNIPLNTHTYHWHGIGFDGPALPMDRGYDVPDNSFHRGTDAETGYYVQTDGVHNGISNSPIAPFTLNNVDLTNARGAVLNNFVSYFYNTSTMTLNYRLNGNAWHPLIPANQYGDGAQRGWSTPVNMAELKQGTNTLEFKEIGNDQGWNTVISNIDLTVFPNSSEPLPSISAMPSSMPTIMPTASPTILPTATPTQKPTSTPTTGSIITIIAAGQVGGGVNPSMTLTINGKNVQTWSVGGDAVNGIFQTFTFTNPAKVTHDKVQVKFTNDFYQVVNGVAQDRNLRVQKITIDGVNYPTVSPSVYSVGSWTNATKCSPGFKKSEWLMCNGYFKY